MLRLAPGGSGHHGGDRVAEARIAIGCVNPRPMRMAGAEARLIGASVTDLEHAAREASDAAADAVDPADDLYGLGRRESVRRWRCSCVARPRRGVVLRRELLRGATCVLRVKAIRECFMSSSMVRDAKLEAVLDVLLLDVLRDGLSSRAPKRPARPRRAVLYGFCRWPRR